MEDEFLNFHWFNNLSEDKRLIEDWRIDYDVSRPHMVIGSISSIEYVLRVRLLEQNTGSDAVRNYNGN